MEQHLQVPRLRLETAGVLSEEEDSEEEASSDDEERVDHLQVLATTISFLRDGAHASDDERESADADESSVSAKRRRLVPPLEAAYTHFERQQDDLQKAAAFGKMLLEKNNQLEEQLDVYNNSSILNEYQDKIRLQQEKIWELQGREETLKTEFEELKVELKVKKRLLNSKTRLAEQLEAKLWDYIQKMEKEKENRENENSKKTKRELDQKEKARKLSDEVENCKDELREAKNENERLRKQVAHLLEKVGSVRSELTRERERKGRSNSFSRRLSSFFITKSENDVGDLEGDEAYETGFWESDGESGGGSSTPSSRRHSGRGRQQFLSESHLNEQLQHRENSSSGVTSAGADLSTQNELAEWKEKARLLKEENDSLRRELGGLSDDHMKLRESVNSMRDHERRLEKERKRERKLLAQSQQTIEELKLRIIDAQLLDSPSSITSTPADDRDPASRSLPVSFSLPATPHLGNIRAQDGQSDDFPLQSPLPLPSTPQPTTGHTPIKPQRYQSMPAGLHYQPQASSFLAEMQERDLGKSMQDELAAIDDILADTEEKNETRLTTPRVTPSTPSPSIISTPRKAASSPSHATAMPTTPVPEDKEKRVWVVAEGQRGRSGLHEKRQTPASGSDNNRSAVSSEIEAPASQTKRENDGRLFIFAEELEKKVVEKFVYDEEELKAGLQQEVEACVADFLAKREQELQSIEPAVLKARRKRSISGERDDLLLFFGVFLTSPSDDAATAVLTSSPEASDSGRDHAVGKEKLIYSSDTSDRDDEEEDEDGWHILDEWRAGRRAGDDSANSESTTSKQTRGRTRLGSVSGNGTGNSGVVGSEHGRSLSAVQTWVKHIPFDLNTTRRRDSESESVTDLTSTTTTTSSTPAVSVLSALSSATEAADDELAKIEAAIDGLPSVITTVTQQPMPASSISASSPSLPAIEDKAAGEGDQAKLLRHEKELAELERLLISRRKEFEVALRAIVTVVPGTFALPRRHLRLREAMRTWPRWPLNVLDLVLYD